MVEAHGVGTTPVTWNREISRLMSQRCTSCHRPDGSAFSLLTYRDAQPRANEIKDAVLSRRMPPWGAVKGFGSFRNDAGLSQEQIETISRWVDGGIRRGNSTQQPAPSKMPAAVSSHEPVVTTRVSGRFTLTSPLVLDGLLPERVETGQSLRIVARTPDGRVQPLVWLHEYKSEFRHPFLFRTAIRLPAGTIIDGVPSSASVGLITVQK
jgi:hypothetical protein